MKKLIAEICKREGKKSVSSKANVAEILRCLAEIISEEGVLNGHEAVNTIEFLQYLEDKSKKVFANFDRELKMIILDYRFNPIIAPPPKVQKKKAKKNA